MSLTQLTFNKSLLVMTGDSLHLFTRWSKSKNQVEYMSNGGCCSSSASLYGLGCIGE